MAKRPIIVITASSLGCFFKCPRQYYLSYVCGWRKRVADDSLRFGTAFHKGLEEWFKGTPANAAVFEAIATAGDAQEFDAETVMQLKALLNGYFAKWEGAIDAKVMPEREFAVKFPFLRGCVVCGKMDGIVEYSDGHIGIIEHKTTSEAIGPMDDYWQTINRDQVALYKAAAQKEGIDVTEVLYDVIRKPTIHLGKNETPDEYGSRLANDCIGAANGENPRSKDYKRGADFYFARRTIPLLSTDMDALARRLFVFKKIYDTMNRCAKRIVSDGGNEIEAYPKCGSAMVCKTCPFRGGVCNSSELPEDSWEKGRMFEELTVAKKYLA